MLLRLCTLANLRRASMVFLFFFTDGFSYARRTFSSLNKPLLDSLFLRIFKAFSTSLSNTLTSSFSPSFLSYISCLFQNRSFSATGIKKGQYGAAQNCAVIYPACCLFLDHAPYLAITFFSSSIKASFSSRLPTVTLMNCRLLQGKINGLIRIPLRMSCSYT